MNRVIPRPSIRAVKIQDQDPCILRSFRCHWMPPRYSSEIGLKLDLVYYLVLDDKSIIEE
jgi:hypothetical protein